MTSVHGITLSLTISPQGDGNLNSSNPCISGARLSLTISPQGDGNETLVRKAVASPKILSLTISPQGDGNYPMGGNPPVQPTVKLFHWPFPRKGTETLTRQFDRWRFDTAFIDHFPARGRKLEKQQLRWEWGLSLTISPQGDGNTKMTKVRKIWKTFIDHFPARGRKHFIHKKSSTSLNSFIDHFPARGRKQSAWTLTLGWTSGFHWPFPRKGTETFFGRKYRDFEPEKAFIDHFPARGRKRWVAWAFRFACPFHWPFPRKGTET